MLLNFVGNGSCFNVSRGNNCAYYKENNKILFLDFGENIFERVKNSNILNDVDEIFVAITHLHTDHIGSLPSFILYNYYEKNIKTQIVGSSFVEKDLKLKKFLELTGITDVFYDFCTQELNKSFKKLKNCTFCKVAHTEEVGQSYAINMVFNGNKRVFYSGDTNDIQYVQMVCQLLRPQDEFYCDTCIENIDTGHFHLDKLANIFPKQKRNQVYCMHLNDDTDLIEQKVSAYGFNVAKVNYPNKFDEQTFLK